NRERIGQGAKRRDRRQPDQHRRHGSLPFSVSSDHSACWRGVNLEPEPGDRLSAEAPRFLERSASRRGSAAVAAGPDQGVLAALALEQRGVDRGGKRRIVELDRQVLAALAGLLSPGGSGFGVPGEETKVGAVLAAVLDGDELGFDVEGEG